MNLATGALLASASSTKWMILAMVLSEAGLSTRTVSTASVAMLPANSVSPGALATGMLSPVTGASSMPAAPSTMVPSAGTRPPGCTRTRSPTASAATGTSRALPPSSSSATLSASAASAWMLAAARHRAQGGRRDEGVDGEGRPRARARPRLAGQWRDADEGGGGETPGRQAREGERQERAHGQQRAGDDDEAALGRPVPGTVGRERCGCAGARVAALAGRRGDESRHVPLQ